LFSALRAGLAGDGAGAGARAGFGAGLATGVGVRTGAGAGMGAGLATGAAPCATSCALPTKAVPCALRAVPCALRLLTPPRTLSLMPSTSISGRDLSASVAGSLISGIVTSGILRFLRSAATLILSGISTLYLIDGVVITGKGTTYARAAHVRSLR